MDQCLLKQLWLIWQRQWQIINYHNSEDVAFSAAFSGGVPIEAEAHELFLDPLMAFWENLGGHQGHIYALMN